MRFSMRLAPRFVLGFLSVTLVTLVLGKQSLAQDVRYAEEPTRGLHLPSAGLAGQVDATTVTTNPAGLGLLDGPQLALALDLTRDGSAVRGGAGGGVYFASAAGGGLLPKLGWGMSLEWLRPERTALLPDPGSPTRFTQSTSLKMGESSSIGFSWHHYFDDEGQSLAGLNTYDLGWTSRFGPKWAAGAVIRDLGAPTVAGSEVSRRYEAEIVSRPFGSDRLEFGLGGRLGEVDVDLANGNAIDGWLKWSLRVARGVYLRGEVGTESLHRITTGPATSTDEFVRDYRVSLGLDISFGGLGTAAYGTLVRDPDGEFLTQGGTMIARLSPVHVPSVMPESRHIQRIDIKGGISQRRLTSLIARLRRIADNDKVVALFINLDGASAGWASLHELRNELLRVRSSGKKIFAFMVAGNTREYYLASAADKIYVDPAGGIRLQGFSGTSLYFAGMFKKMGISAQFEKIEEYKSAPEAWMRTGPSEPALRMRNELYDSIYGTIVRDIATSRGISEVRVRELIDQGPYTAGDLTKLPDLIDGVVLPDDLGPLVASELGRVYPFDQPARVRPETWDRRKVAVIYIVGDIVGGESRRAPLVGRRLVGGKTIAEAIATANADPDIEAIVLRINTPGGSALASEIMAREVGKVRGNKPIICSMADLAASGGYFAAAYCDRIFADPMTITGSIGIFNGSFDLSKLLTKFGLSWTTFKRGAHSDLGSFYRPMTDEERKFMKEKLRYFYGRFVSTVADGRGMTPAAVDKVGRGHVWTGEQSMSIRLVDELGGLFDAVEYAKQKAGFVPGEKASLVLLPKERNSILNQLLGSPFGLAKSDSGESKSSAEERAISAFIGALLPGGAAIDMLKAIPGSLWAEPDSVQARLPFSILWSE